MNDWKNQAVFSVLKNETFKNAKLSPRIEDQHPQNTGLPLLKESS